jgi:hypothetical protein
VLQSNPAAGGVLSERQVSISPLQQTAERIAAGGGEQAEEWMAALASVQSTPPFPPRLPVWPPGDDDSATAALLQRRLPARALAQAAGGAGSWEDRHSGLRGLGEDAPSGPADGGADYSSSSSVQPILRVSTDVLSQLELMLERCAAPPPHTHTHTHTQSLFFK